MVEQRSWVKTPFQYTTLGAGLSLIQQQALLMVSEHLQTYIKRFFELKLDRAKDAPKSLFTEHVLREGIPPFRIWLQDLGVLPSNYDTARKAIDEINLQVEHQEMDADGRPTGRTIRTNVFSQFGFESSGDYYHYRDREGGEQAVERMNPYIDVKINPDVAMWAFDMSKGYVNHLKLIALYSTKRPTPRIYMLLMRAMTKNDHYKDLRIPLGELKEYLGIVPYKDKRGNLVTPYPMFSNFRQKVLDAVRDDLDRMAAERPTPKTDITFTYEPVYPGHRRKGDPEAILFHIERTVLGDAYNIVVNHVKPRAAQLSLFTDAEDPYRQTFTDTIQRIIATVTDDSERDAYTRLTYEHYDDLAHSLLLQVDSRQHYDWVESDAIRPSFFTHLQQSFPGITTLNYRLPKEKLKS